MITINDKYCWILSKELFQPYSMGEKKTKKTHMIQLFLLFIFVAFQWQNILKTNAIVTDNLFIRPWYVKFWIKRHTKIQTYPFYFEMMENDSCSKHIYYLVNRLMPVIVWQTINVSLWYCQMLLADIVNLLLKLISWEWLRWATGAPRKPNRKNIHFPYYYLPNRKHWEFSPP